MIREDAIKLIVVVIAVTMVCMMWERSQRGEAKFRMLYLFCGVVVFFLIRDILTSSSPIRIFVIYGLLYVVGSIVGYVYEQILRGKAHTLHHITGFYTIYGIGALVLLLIKRTFPNVNMIALSIGAAIVFSFFECLSGSFTQDVVSSGVWKYSDGIPLCNGYTSVKLIAIWSIFAFSGLTLFRIAENLSL